MNIVERRIRLRRRRWLVAAGKVERKIETRIQAETVYGDVAGESGVSRGSHELQVGVRYRTHAWRIPQSDLVTGGGQVEIRIALDRDVAAEVQIAAAASGSELFDLQAVLIEVERAIDLAQAVRQVNEGDRTVRDLELAVEVRFVHGSADLKCGL